jgi:transcriptional regulator with XRE-family HTH domain
VSTVKLEKVRGVFADRIRALRKAKGWGQEDLAQRLDVSNGAVGYWEIGPNIPHPKTLKKIAALFEVEVAYLLGSEVSGPGSGLLQESVPGHLVDDLHAELERLDEQMAAVKRAAHRLKPSVSSKAGALAAAADQILLGGNSSGRRKASKKPSTAKAGVPVALSKP